MDTIKFSHNWNNKLDCHAFTTLRRSNPRRYAAISDFITWIDTGYSLDECKGILRKMYPDVIEQTPFDLVLLRKTCDDAEQGQADLFLQMCVDGV
jgi:hypothetical protein